MKRILIVGVTGTGKTTLARELGKRLDLPAIDLDELYWLPGWVGRDDEDFKAQVTAATMSNGWIVAGNYTRVRSVFWDRVDTLIWLDYGFWFNLVRLARRSIKNIWRRRVVCNGNIETFSLLFSRTSIVRWFFRSYFRTRRNHAALFAASDHAQGRRLIHLRNQTETDRFVAALPSQ